MEMILFVKTDENGDPLLSCLGKIIGILSIGNPVARFKKQNIFEIIRICFLLPNFNPYKNGFELPVSLLKSQLKNLAIDI